LTAADKSKTEPTRRVVWGRRFLAATVVVPPDVAEHLNMDAMAVLAVIRNEAQTLPVARIAKRTNIGQAKVRAAIKLAESLGIIAIEKTPPGGKREIINRGIMSRC
jgi:DNA-binding transcriptional regulator LsrR (DeoR family)